MKQQGYQDRLKRVCDYIQTHVDDDLTIETLSQVALFSKYHFHRLFAHYMGMNVARYILLSRLKRASYQLAFKPELRIIDIALNAGFENPESFSRSFKQTFNQTPSQFRQQPHWADWSEIIKRPRIERIQKMDVEIINFKMTKIAVKEHRGSPALLNESVADFIAWRKGTGLSPVATSDTYGLAYDDPNTTEPEAFRFDICGSVVATVPANHQGVINKAIPAGRCARVRHLGSHDNIGEAVYFLYREWLPDSGEELRDFPCFFHYRNLISEVDEHELITDIYLPLN